MEYDPKLLEFAQTETQAQYYSAVLSTGSIRKAAKSLGRDESTIRSSVNRIKKRAASKGYAPEAGLDKVLPEGQVVKGISYKQGPDGKDQGGWLKTTQEGVDENEACRLPDPKTITKESIYLNAERKVTAQWISTKPSLEEQKTRWEDFADLLAKRLPILEKSKPPKLKSQSEDLLAVYPVGDHHIGMLAWERESPTHESYDLKIAEDTLKSATDHLIDGANHAAHSLIAILGDFMHYDGVDPVTTRSKNILDTDTRYAKMADVALECIMYMIDAALRVHQTVHIIYEVGNHDDSSALLMMAFLKRLYKNEPRVTVDDSPQYFHYYQFGKNLIMTHHGHSTKLDALPLLMATDVPKMWGDTEHRCIFTGHVHHKQRLNEKEYGGVIVESMPVLAASDAHANQKGYRSGRRMHSVIYHKEHGEVERRTVTPGMLP